MILSSYINLNFYTITQSDARYYTQTQSDTKQHSKTYVNSNQYTITQSDARWYAQTQSNLNYYFFKSYINYTCLFFNSIIWLTILYTNSIRYKLVFNNIRYSESVYNNTSWCYIYKQNKSYGRCCTQLQSDSN